MAALDAAVTKQTVPGVAVVNYLVKLIGTSALLALIIIYVSGQPHAGLDQALHLITG
jgi:hypothetical protein